MTNVNGALLFLEDNAVSNNIELEDISARLAAPELDVQDFFIDLIDVKQITLIDREAELLRHDPGRVCWCSAFEDVVRFELHVGQVLDLTSLGFNRTSLAQDNAYLSAELEAQLDTS